MVTEAKPCGVFVFVDDETGKPDEPPRMLSVDPARYAGRHLVRVDTTDSGSCEWGGVAWLLPEDAIAAGERLLRLGQEAKLRAAGWLPVTHEACTATRERLPGTWSIDDWTPPEDRTNLWSFDAAVLELARREEGGR